uniref:Uncharacterized protein n=1 Tax=Ralstonia solanacearum TaxID=305 RepID=A0A0S4WK32_RALSL|nr:protein of unknown function [Ralstonia solanacearum]
MLLHSRRFYFPLNLRGARAQPGPAPELGSACRTWHPDPVGRPQQAASVLGALRFALATRARWPKTIPFEEGDEFRYQARIVQSFRPPRGDVVDDPELTKKDHWPLLFVG